MARKPKISPKRFIWTWQNSRSAADVAKRLDRSLASVLTRSYYFRKKGVRLREFTTQAPYDWHALAEYADTCANKDAVPVFREKGE